jgi:hypothetical protein
MPISPTELWRPNGKPGGNLSNHGESFFPKLRSRRCFLHLGRSGREAVALRIIWKSNQFDCGPWCRMIARCSPMDLSRNRTCAIVLASYLVSPTPLDASLDPRKSLRRGHLQHGPKGYLKFESCSLRHIFNNFGVATDH